ncbi:MAG: hypothetical protein JWP66_1963 [Naasia sp.]|nr:hypothetical protein [Naasia sp.]
MPRPPMVGGTWGRVARVKRGDTWVASARFRDFDGVTRQIERRGSTGRKAEDALVTHLRDRSRIPGADMSGDSRIAELAEAWFLELQAQGRSTNTLQLYRRALDRLIITAMGELRLREASVPAVDRFLAKVGRTSGYSSAKVSKVVLTGMFALAVSHGATPANPARDSAAIVIPRREVQTVDVAEVAELRRRLRDWDAGRTRKRGDTTSDLADVIDMLLATGARTGEALALRWKDVNLAASPPRVDILGTLVDVAGEGLRIQTRPKTDTSRRELLLPPFAADMLLRRRVNGHSELVFPSSTGTIRSPHNFRRQWREFRQHHGYPDWVTPKTFRKVVATLIRDSVDLQTASAQLGHSSSTVTAKHYAGRVHEGPDVTAVLEQLGG